MCAGPLLILHVRHAVLNTVQSRYREAKLVPWVNINRSSFGVSTAAVHNY